MQGDEEGAPKLVRMREPTDLERIKLANEALPRFAPLLKDLADKCAGENPAQELRALVGRLGAQRDTHAEELRGGAKETRDPDYLRNWQGALELLRVFQEVADLAFEAGAEKPGMSIVNESLTPKAE